MKIHEIDVRILECIDEETGEILDEDMLRELEMERDAKISNVACLYKDTIALVKAIKEERSDLLKRQQSAENRAESCKKFLEFALGGEKFKDGRVSISYRKSESVQVEDVTKLPEEYQKVTVEAKKTELKDAIKAGKTFEGVYLEEKNNMQIR